MHPSGEFGEELEDETEGHESSVMAAVSLAGVGRREERFEELGGPQQGGEDWFTLWGEEREEERKRDGYSEITGIQVKVGVLRDES